jgi:hypothetical protein
MYRRGRSPYPCAAGDKRLGISCPPSSSSRCDGRERRAPGQQRAAILDPPPYGTRLRGLPPPGRARTNSRAAWGVWAAFWRSCWWTAIDYVRRDAYKGCLVAKDGSGMAATAIELFRAGNKSGPKFDHIRSHVVVQSRNGVDWVIGRSGGASTQQAPGGLRGTWYALPANTTYDDAILYVWNDYPGHWSWEPRHDMPLSDYVAALAALNAHDPSPRAPAANFPKRLSGFVGRALSQVVARSGQKADQQFPVVDALRQVRDLIIGAGDETLTVDPDRADKFPDISLNSRFACS